MARLLIAAGVLGVFGATALGTALYQPAKGTLTNALIPFVLVALVRKGRGMPEAFFAALHIGYASWYLPLRFHPYLTEAAVLEAMFFITAAVYFGVRPSPLPLLCLTLYHRYWSARLLDTYFDLTSGLGLREVPMAAAYLANVLVRWELIALALIIALTSEELRIRAQFWLHVLDRASLQLRRLTPFPGWCARQARLALARR